MPSAHSGGDITPTVSPSPAKAPRLPAPGTTIDRYLVIDPIGAGGVGMVVRAYDPKLQREVALKILHTETLGPNGRRVWSARRGRWRSSITPT